MPEKILVVDDERIILELTSMILRSKGYQVLTAESGREGLAKVEQAAPAVVLLDYMMPVMDGMTALRQIRERFPDTYVIMFTGKGSEEIAVELMKAGASDYILKPFNNQDLIERIEHVLRLRRIELQNRELQAERERLLQEIEQWNRELERRVEEKTQALERAHAEIVQAEKLVTLGHLSAGMAHEIRNPLNSISLFAQILKSALEDDAEQVTYADKIIKEVDRIDDILIKVLATSKRPRYDLQIVSVAEVIEHALEKIADQLLVQRIEVEKDLSAMVPQILADATEIEQIFSNLFTNSLHEMPAGGRLSIRLANDNQNLIIDVSDSGGGIPPENMNKIFEPFFTTKAKGTGFGLSVVLRIVKTYGGRISVQSQPGQGTAFRINLPLTSAMAGG
ncbi:MAG: response regulator [Desulfuromonadales bacterium]|nr:response regulator [Desulfuromonadales bacterium]